MKPKIPCYLRIERIKRLIVSDPEISEEQVHLELLKDYSDAELHEMSEQEILNLILRVMFELRKKMDIKSVRLRPE